MRVILIHGMFTGTRCWDLVDERLRERGIAAERASLHPGGAAKRDRDFEAVTASVRAQIERSDDEPSVLVGHSLGALVVEKLLPAFPVASAVLVNPSPGWGSFGPIYPLWIAARRGLFWRKVVHLNRDECGKLLFQGMSGQPLDAAFEVVEPESGELMRQAFWFFDLFAASTRIAPVSPRNVSLLTGALDPMATPAYCRRLAARFGASAEVEVLADACHMLMIQDAGARTLANRIASALAARE